MLKYTCKQVVLPKSHWRHERLVADHRLKDYVEFEPDDARLAGLGHMRQVAS